MIIKRFLQEEIEQRLADNEQLYQKQSDIHKKRRAIIIYGARQVGKTTLVKEILKSYGEAGKYFNCEYASDREALETNDPKIIKNFIGKAKLVVFDEAQKIRDAGLALKIIVDSLPDIQIIATGSSSFDLADKINEPMTGRKYQYMLYPLSYNEISEQMEYNKRPSLEQMLVLGLYPDVFLTPWRIEILR